MIADDAMICCIQMLVKLTCRAYTVQLVLNITAFNEYSIYSYHRQGDY